MGNEASQNNISKQPETRQSLVYHPQQENNQWRMRFQHPHLLQTLGGQQEGNYFRYYFEFCELTLASLLSERYGTKKYFPEEDLQALLLGISSALSFLQEQGISHGDICPAEIYFDASSSSFKILDSNLINGRASGMQQVLAGKLKYLSPECYQGLGQPLTEAMLYKNDIWCLGMTILESAILKPSEIIYQTGLHPSAIYERIVEVSQIYNQTFANTILMMLNFNENDRPDAINLFNYLLNLQRVAEYQNIQQIPSIIPQPQIPKGVRTLQGSPQKSNIGNSQISQQQSRYAQPKQQAQPSSRPKTPTNQRNLQTDQSPKYQPFGERQYKQTIMCQPTIRQVTQQNFGDLLTQQSPANQKKVSHLFCQPKSGNQSPYSPYGNGEQITPQKVVKMIVYPGDQERSPKSAITPSKVQQQILTNYDPPVLRNVTNQDNVFGTNLTKTQHFQTNRNNYNQQPSYLGLKQQQRGYQEQFTERYVKNKPYKENFP